MTKLALFLAALLAPLSLAAPASLRARQLGTTANDLVDGSPCKNLLLIFARGTTELGNIGETVGPLLGDNLEALLGVSQVAVQGVDYPADIPGFLEGGDPTGSATMASLVSQAITQCPDSKIVIGGYSQGGQLVHNAAKTFSAAETARITAAVIFGDPDDGQAIGSVPASRTDVICLPGDDICAGGDLVLPAHLSYEPLVPSAAAFVVSVSGLSAAK